MTSFIEPNMFERIDAAFPADPVTNGAGVVAAVAPVAFKKNSKAHSA